MRTLNIFQFTKQISGNLSIHILLRNLRGYFVDVAGRNAGLLAQTLAPLRGEPGLQLQPGRATLEDVFIGLIDGAHDNFAPDAQKGTRP